MDTQDRPWTKNWINNLRKDERFKDIRLKRLEKGYPPFEIDESLIDVVSAEEFVKIEEKRLPLFIGSQFGIHPDTKKIPDFFNGHKLIAILAKSLLSGSVDGLSIYEIDPEVRKLPGKKIYRISN